MVRLKYKIRILDAAKTLSEFETTTNVWLQIESAIGVYDPETIVGNLRVEITKTEEFIWTGPIGRNMG